MVPLQPFASQSGIYLQDRKGQSVTSQKHTEQFHFITPNGQGLSSTSQELTSLLSTYPFASALHHQQALMHWAREIAENDGVITTGGCKWYKGATMPNDASEEFDEDASYPIQNLSACSPHSPEDAKFSYCMEDIDYLSSMLGIPWKLSKDKAFSFLPPFIGFIWDLPGYAVQLSEEKRTKYLQAILSWESKCMHTLDEVQKLYGKLLHASLIIPIGCAYLTNLKGMLGTFGQRPFVPRTPPSDTPADLKWWKDVLNSPNTISCAVPGPCIVYDFNAYSDASSGHGIGITIRSRWRAWELIPGWNRDGCNIGWAESIGFEFLIRTIITSNASRIYFKVYGDNCGVVEGWWKGHSRSRACNEVFKHIHQVAASAKCTILTRYVPSKENPADGPSQGIYPPPSLLLPKIPIPSELSSFIVDVSDHTIIAKCLCADSSQLFHPVVKNYIEPESQQPKDRLYLWTPTSSRSQHDAEGQIVPLAAADVRRIQDVIIHVKAIPEDQRAPASQILISSFISCMAGNYSGKTISNYVHRVHAWHVLHGAAWTLVDAEIDTLLKTASSLTPASSKRNKREPYTIDLIIAIHNQLNLTRTGEFTVSHLNAFDASIHVKPSDVSTIQDRQSLITTNFHLPRTKSAPEGESVFWAKQLGPSDPQEAFLTHLQVNNPPTGGALFAY
ncbi:hypothetical protein AZE42_12009 [Rhizopogon vesiculosus]|uniref:Uncharacterized protein n=1 Tax=Rhizopogon vesiculosus TaxID=180088 RepID=A0A1J8QB87_9AGAM|nr:hypothetical protein AZE42_12009 [Rhizopogon vesiculosus]